MSPVVFTEEKTGKSSKQSNSMKCSGLPTYTMNGIHTNVLENDTKTKSFSKKIEEMEKDLSGYPDAAWETIKENQKFQAVVLPDPDQVPISPDKIRFVCMSDTHTKTDNIRHPIPEGDVFLHAGDFTLKGTLEEGKTFNKWLGTLPHRHKVVIAGNHEVFLDAGSESLPFLKSVKPDEVLTNAIYLQEAITSIYGIRIYGAPWTPNYRVMAFNLERGDELREKWSTIPEDIDILMTHGPPLGRGDLNTKDERSGCFDLLHTIQSRVKPKYHICGHIHEGYGASSDGHTTYINASTCNVKYEPIQKPIVFDVPLPKGYTKNDGGS